MQPMDCAASLKAIDSLNLLMRQPNESVIGYVLSDDMPTQHLKTLSLEFDIRFPLLTISRSRLRVLVERSGIRRTPFLLTVDRSGDMAIRPL